MKWIEHDIKSLESFVIRSTPERKESRNMRVTVLVMNPVPSQSY